MAASEHINPFIKAYHISWDTTPPHELKPRESHVVVPGSNVHPDILHMGTRRAAVQIHRTHLHEYEIDQTKMNPVTFADSEDMIFKTTQGGRDWGPFNRSMQGKQEGLWENVTPDTEEVVNKGVVVSYRNRGEDPGSLSFMVPKSAIASGAVRYKGVTDLTAKDESGRTTRDKIEEEEGMYRYERKV